MTQEEQIRAEILSEDLKLNELLERYPDRDQWDLRRLFSNAHKSRTLNRVKEARDRTVLPPTAAKKLPKSARTVIESGMWSPISLEFDTVPKRDPMFPKTGRTILIGSDFHSPVHDPHALDLFIQVGRAVDPDIIILNGDVFDVSSLSRFDNPHDRPFRWVDERKEALECPTKIRAAFPDTRIIFKTGNHDIRPEAWIQKKAEPLGGLFSLPELLGITDLGFEFRRKPIFLADDKLSVKHGTNVSKHSAYSVKREIEGSGLSVIMGHTHRRGLHEMTQTRQRLREDQAIIGVESGCLCLLDPDYVDAEDTTNWQQGFVVVTEFEDGFFAPELARVDYGFARFRGRLFRSRLIDPFADAEV